MSRNLGFSFDAKGATSYDLSDSKTFADRWPLPPGAYVFRYLDPKGVQMGASAILLFTADGKISTQSGGNVLTLEQFKLELAKDADTGQVGVQAVGKLDVKPAYAFVFTAAQALLDAIKGEPNSGPVPYGDYTVTVVQDGKTVQASQVFSVNEKGFLSLKEGTPLPDDPWGAYAKGVQNLYATFPKAVVTMVPTGAVKPPVLTDPTLGKIPGWVLAMGGAVLLLWLLKRKKPAQHAA